jgi:hypothetical protein
MPIVSVPFSNRPQHVLRYTVNSDTSADGLTTFFNWSGRVVTSGNTRGPYGTGTYNNTTSPATTPVSGVPNTNQNFSYDYRNNFNRSYSLPGGRRSAVAGSPSRTFTLDVTMGGLIGSATAQIVMSTGTAPVPEPEVLPAEAQITATAESPTSIRVVWSTTNSPTFVSVSGTGMTTRNTASGNVLATGLQPNTSYEYSITAFNEANQSNPSQDTASARTLLPAPTLTITATTLTSTTARVVWSTTNADSASITGTNLSSTELNGNEIVTGLTRNTIYRWSGSAANADGNSGTVQSNSITTLNVLGGVWTGSTFAVPNLKVWTGSSWTEKQARVWTGSEWKVWV